MTDTDIIAKQARKIIELQTLHIEYVRVLNSIQSEMYCIGGPLNDNVQNYNNKQLLIFARIAELIDELL